MLLKVADAKRVNKRGTARYAAQIKCLKEVKPGK